MSFRGPALSIDDEGSILFDGEKFIVNVPADDDLLEHFNPPENIPIVYTRPPAAPYVPPPVIYTAFDKHKAEEHVEHVRTTRESARNRQSKPSDPVVPDDLPGETKPDISEKEVFDVCGNFCQQNPQAMTAVMNIIEGANPEDDEQTIQQRVSNHLRIMGLNDAFGHGDWYTTRLDPYVEGTATRIVDYYFDRVEASNAALAAMPVTQAESIPAQSQVHAGTNGFVQPEISFLLQWSLTEAFPGEWDPRWTTKGELQDFLVSDLKRVIHGFDETARIMPGFDEIVINWADLSVEELMYFYRVEIALELVARGEHYEGLPPGYDEIKASLDRATELESLAGPIPLDDTQAYAAKFAGRVRIEDAEDEREHVQDQLAVIYKHLNIAMPENYLDGRSTSELKYELYYRLNYDVLPFVSRDEYEIQLRISDFMTDYASAARDTPEGVIDRLQGTFHQPDVLGFLFVMGLSIAFEPVDYVLTAVDVIQALSEGDKKSAGLHLLFGAAPLLKSGMVGGMKHLGRTPNQISNFSELNIRQGYQRLGSDYVMEVDNYVSRTVSNYNSRNAGLLNTQMKRAAKVDDRFARRLKTHSKQDMHHIVPTGRWQGDEARDILSEKGVYVNSAYNGIALEKSVHKLTNVNSDYTEAISKVIVKLKDAPPEIIEKFLEETTERLHKLNEYKDYPLRLEAEYQTEIMDWFAGFPD